MDPTFPTVTSEQGASSSSAGAAPMAKPVAIEPTPPRGSGRMRHIDTLRAIAALLVVWLHVSDAFVHISGGRAAGGQWLNSLAHSVDVGRVGVVVFFLISGFVIPFSIHADRAAPIGSFLIKRLLRIYPAYWLSVPLGALTGYWIWGQHFGTNEILVNLSLLQDVFGVRPAIGLYWTLLVEIAFYALCVALLLAGSLFNMRRICALAIALGLGFSVAMVSRWAGVPVLGSAAAFWMLNLSILLCGTLYRRCIVDEAALHDPWLRTAVYGLFLFYLAILPLGTLWAVGFAQIAPFSYALGLLIFIVGASFVRISTPLTDWLGRISYSIYLFHPIVFMTVLWWLLQTPVDSWWRTQNLIIYLLINIALTIAVAAAIHRFVEQPCINLGHRLAKRWARRKTHDDNTAPLAPLLAESVDGT